MCISFIFVETKQRPSNIILLIQINTYILSVVFFQELIDSHLKNINEIMCNSATKDHNNSYLIEGVVLV